MALFINYEKNVIPLIIIKIWKNHSKAKEKTLKFF